MATQHWVTGHQSPCPSFHRSHLSTPGREGLWSPRLAHTDSRTPHRSPPAPVIFMQGTQQLLLTCPRRGCPLANHTVMVSMHQVYIPKSTSAAPRRQGSVTGGIAALINQSSE
ncbi:hypothetical protein E2C01_004397 [Portunus trituberculatus]|uniref:Uncharacterized protein n=1 Tax=Portunus trituberculatus TaxID=210409 RepID=A0A5B7CW99_PORTR|nr:hypothetical protein [Portunus trituberculatus]